MTDELAARLLKAHIEKIRARAPGPALTSASTPTTDRVTYDQNLNRVQTGSALPNPTKETAMMTKYSTTAATGNVYMPCEPCGGKKDSPTCNFCFGRGKVMVHGSALPNPTKETAMMTKYSTTAATGNVYMPCEPCGGKKDSPTCNFCFGRGKVMVHESGDIVCRFGVTVQSSIPGREKERHRGVVSMAETAMGFALQFCNGEVLCIPAAQVLSILFVPNRHEEEC